MQKYKNNVTHSIAATKKGSSYIQVVPYTLMQISQIIKENNLNN